MIDIHALCVPVAERYLARLDAILEMLASHVEQALITDAALDSRLRDGMPPLGLHVRIAMDFPFRALRQIAPDRITPELANASPLDPTTIAALRGSIAVRQAILSRLSPADLLCPAGAILTDKAGDAIVETDSATFVSQYVLPNFFFHVSAVYFGLRLLGLPLGKADFDGFHAYPRESA